METKFTEQDSLRIITEMITQARNNFRKGAGNQFLFWGYVVGAIALLNFVLLYILPSPSYSFWVWILTIPAYIGSGIYQSRQDKENVAITHIDIIISKVWLSYLIGCVLLLLIIFTLGFAAHQPVAFLLITPIILLLLGMCLFVTGYATKYAPYKKASFAFWVGSVLTVASFFAGCSGIQFLILALCMLVGFVIPGHLANKEAEQHV